MIVNYSIDENNRLQNVTSYPLDKTKPTIELPEDFDFKNVRDYILNDDTLKLDPFIAIPSIEEQIAVLKQKLSDTDYITSKALDAITLADNLTSLLAALKSIRTEYADLIKQRQSWREEINNLEKQMETI